MGKVEHAIRNQISEGQVLQTPSRQVPFTLDRIDHEGVVLLLGAGRWPVRLSWECLEGVVPFLAERGTIPIGGRHVSEPNPGTLDEYLKTCTKVDTAGWVAVVLERAGVVEIVRDRPAKVRLAALTDHEPEVTGRHRSGVVALGVRFDQALAYAAAVNGGQVRKGNNVPYIAHVMGTASLVLEVGSDEDMAIAALLHDAADSQGGEERLADISRCPAPYVGTGVDTCVRDTGMWRSRTLDELAVPAPYRSASLRRSPVARIAAYLVCGQTIAGSEPLRQTQAPSNQSPCQWRHRIRRRWANPRSCS